MDFSDWTSLVAAISAAIAAIASCISVFLTNQREKNNKKPIVVPGMKIFDVEIRNLLSDWGENKEIPKKFSNTTLPICNHGNTPAFNIRYSFELESKLDQIQDEGFMQGGRYLIELKESQLYVFIKEGEYFKSEVRDVHSYTRTLDEVAPLSKTGIFIPDYYLILINYYFFNSLNKSFLSSKNKPHSLILKIMYDDINFSTWVQEFKIYIPPISKFNGHNLEARIEYKKSSKRKKVKS
ncbi:hypothetical protein [Halomonas sp. PAR8]|uniref:hypothetical protein n=1 Tax=Halomonas sp. PAR8 TaxID=3075515 RepID=UPI002883ABCB|nr:hypothetical protein [Halomonas sp. PAR8]MDT0593204.1 hypothetical protein [Halomonas sp. PAR8]